MTNHGTDLPRPYGGEKADHGVGWSSLGLTVVVGLALGSFTVYDLTHPPSAIRPILVAVLVVVMGFALVLMLMNVSPGARRRYQNATQYAWQMGILMVVCIILILLLILLP